MTGRNPADFTLGGPDDFVRLDSLCAELMGEFFGWLQDPENGAMPPAEASSLAHAADRFIRDFVVDARETGPADPDHSLPLQYLGNWYIIHTLTPTHAEIDLILRSLRLLYEFLANKGLLTEGTAYAIREGLAEDPLFFHRRLDEFWELTPTAIGAWRAVADYRGARASPPSP